MTISRCEIAIPMLQDILATWSDWHGELQTITGYSWDEYEALKNRLMDSKSPTLTTEDRDMLRQASNQFFGYPGIKTANLQAVIGGDWRDQVNSSFGRSTDK